MLGVGPGQLTSDAEMLGIPPDKQRPRMEEALDVMMRLFRGETVTYECEWFTINGARSGRDRVRSQGSGSDRRDETGP